MDKKKRSGNITEEQKSLLIEFMKVHPQLVSGKFSKTFIYDNAAKLWQDVTEILNACNRAEKNWKLWRKCWQDYRSRSKTKQAEINTERHKTGGGTQYSAVLTPSEEQVLELIPSSLSKGHTDVLESCTDMIFGVEDELNDSSLSGTEEIEFLDDDYNAIQAYEATQATSATQATTEKLNINYKNENFENYDPSLLTKSKHSSSRQKIKVVKDSTHIIAKAAENTYLLKKKYYEEVLRCKKRMAKAHERMATVAEKCATDNCKIM
ncbi:uncharacterized protein LOC105840755 [Monomorium pharaonis]|uniref:uncharacterized protein LOC105840755 n=1 Tax=Monomorium pharaonis TaxID=307658 RepID=UPI00063F666C|nr:uncharacterized protein LOC105840755 [Monomorium pharaonis]